MKKYKMEIYNEQVLNKKCAEFLGIITDNGYWIEFEKTMPNNLVGNYSKRHHIDQLCFHSDWNWIMEIVGRIEDIQTVGQRVYFTISPFEISVYCSGVLEKNLYQLNFKLDGRHFKGDQKTEAVVHAIWEFLNWYNTQKP